MSASNLIGQIFAIDIKDVYAATVQSFQYIFQYTINSYVDI